MPSTPPGLRGPAASCERRRGHTDGSRRDPDAPTRPGSPDARRLKAALDVLAEVSKDLQLIIFTCHEDRYRALGDAAKFIPLG